MSDPWDWYRAAIVAKRAGQPLPPVHEGKPEFGFFWAKASKAGGRIPVCIYAGGNGEIVARWGTKAEHRFESDAAAKWSWIADSVTDRDSYTHAWTQGVWPDGTPTTAPALPAGSNQITDPFERLMAEVDDKVEQAEILFGKLGLATADKNGADMARNIQAGLLALAKTADTMHKAEKQPHLDAGKVVDDKFRFRDTLKGVAGRLRNVFENWMRAEEQRARTEANRKHREEMEKAQAERARIEAERAKLMADDPIAALTSDEPELPDLPIAPEPVKVNAGGGVGRAAGLKTVWTPEVIDYEATLKHFSKHPTIKAAIEKLVAGEARLHKEATAIPGVQMKEERRAA
tara:strand:+ start:1654 stop:2691 length:1038 start_codon:yes stop_codon:yes gene_type:complete